jgi:hypothetical protein
MSDDELNTGDAKKADAAADELRAAMEVLQAKLNAAKIAYLNRVELDGKVPEYEDVAAIAKELIKLNYQLQRALYGKVRLKLSVAKLLRASSR